MKAYLFWKILLLFIILIKIVSSGQITPDPENNIQVNPPNKDMSSPTIIFNFKIGTQLYVSQYIAIKFPYLFSELLSFDQINQFTVEFNYLISDGTYGKIQVRPAISSLLERNIAFIQITDYVISITPDKSYQLALTLVNKTISISNFLAQLSLFTCTDIIPNRIIIDSGIFYGEAGLYSVWDNNKKPPLQISTSTVSLATINVYKTFDVGMTMLVTTFIPSSSMILIRWPSALVSRPYACYTEKVSDNDPQKAELAGISGKLLSGRSDTLVLKGFQDDFVTGRTFIITLKGMKARDTFSTEGKLEVFVYYSNSYSVMSYHSVNVFIIKKATVSSFTAGHPEGWDIFRGTGSPMSYSFSVSTDLPEGGYVLVRQANTSTFNRWNFIASTCDFSANDASISQSFGQRPICVPLGISETKSSETNGSGIFFKLPYIYAEKKYYFTVFGYSDACGSITTTGAKESTAVHTFYLTIYQNIDMTQLDENRLVNSSNKVLAETTIPVAMSSYCFSGRFLSSLTLVQENIDDVYGPANTNSQVDNILVNEIFDFRFSSFTSPDCNGAENCYLSDITTNTYDETFLYPSDSESRKMLNGSYFNLRADLPLPTTQLLYNPRHVLALPVLYSTNTISVQTGRWFFLANKKWLIDGDTSSCFISWGGAWENMVNLNYSFSGVNTTGAPAPSQTCLNNVSSSNTKVNFLVKSSQGTIEVDATNKFKLNSTSTSGVLLLADYTNLKGTLLLANAATHYNFSLFSTCFKFAEMTPKITTPYAYFEYQLIFYNAGKNISRINRFFKFATNIGAIQDTQSPNHISASFSSFGVFHYSVDFTSNYNNAICLIQIKNTDISSISVTSNVLIVILHNFKPLDMDYSNLSATYPASPVEGAACAYAFPSADPSNDPLDLVKRKMEYITPSDRQQYINTYYMQLKPYILFGNYQPYMITSDVLIPVYCPNTRYFSIGLQFFNAESNSYIMNKVNHVVSMTQGSIKQFQMYPSNPKLTTSKLNETNNLSINFAKYTDTTSPLAETLYFKLNSQFFGKTSSSLYCTGFSILLNEKIGVKAEYEISFAINSGTMPSRLYKTNSYFYAFGKKFNKAILAVVASTDTTVQLTYDQANPDGNAYSAAGIIRPSLELFSNGVVGGQMNVNDYISFHCNTSTGDSYDYVSNYAKSSNSFILDFAVDSTTKWTSIQMAYDTEQSLFQVDRAANMIVSFTTPIILYPGTRIEFGLSNLISNSVCGINSSSTQTITPAIECTISDLKNKQTMSCPIPSTGNTYAISCYNLYLSTNTLEIPFITAQLSTPTTISPLLHTISANDSRLIYLNSSYDKSPSLFNFDFAAYSYVSDIVYYYGNSLNAFVKAEFKVVLSRTLPRGAKVIITGDFSKFVVNNFGLDLFSTSRFYLGQKIKCEVFLSSKYNNNNAIKHLCKLTDLNTSTGTVEISFKNLASFSLGKFESFFTFTLFPVFAVDISGTAKNSPQFLVKLQNSNSEDLANNKKQLPIKWSMQGEFDGNNKEMFQIEDLCNLSSIYPRITNENIEGTFTIDLSTNFKNMKSQMPGNRINEYMIYFSEKDIEVNSFVSCSAPNSSLFDFYIYCYRAEDNILVIRFKDSNVDRLNERESTYGIVVRGIKLRTEFNTIEYKVTTINYRFLCSVNSYNTVTRKRTTLLSGTGKGSVLFEESRLLGALSIFSVYSDSTTPRVDARITIRFGFDKYNGISTTIPESLSSPNIIVTFPPGYPMKHFAVTIISPQCTLTEFTGDPNQLSPLSAPVSIEKCRIIGDNTILLTFTEANHTIGNTFRYWEAYIEKVYAPFEEMASVGVFRVTLTDNNSNYAFRSYSNLSTLSYTVFERSIDAYLTYYRGMSYKFANSLFIMDVVSSDGIRINQIVVSPGMYMEYGLKVRNTTSGLAIMNNAQTRFQINDYTFLVYEFPELSFNAKDSMMIFHIGTNCLTDEGVYYSHIMLTNSEEFYPIIPLTILVKRIQGKIKIDTSESIITGKRMKLPITLSNRNFNEISITFLPDQANDEQIKISSSVVIPYYSLTSSVDYFVGYNPSASSSTSTQVYYLKNSNICFDFPNEQMKINIVHSKAGNNNPETVILDKNNFNLLNESTDRELQEKKNLIKMQFTPPVDNGFLVCVLICYDADYPSDEVLMMINDKYESLQNPPIVNAFSRNIISKDVISISFPNLIRGETYKLKCALKFSVLNSNNENVFYVKSCEMDSIPSEKTSAKFQLLDSMPSHCVNINFKSKLDSLVMSSMVTYCHNLIEGLSGCLTCVDNYGNIHYSDKLSEHSSCWKKGTGEMSSNNRVNKWKIFNKSLTSAKYEHNPLYYTALVANTAKMNMNFNFTVFPMVVQEDFPYTICVIQDKICPYTVDVNVVNDKLNKLLYSMSNSYMIYLSLGIKSIEVTAGALKIDTTPPDISTMARYILGNPYGDSSGYYNVKIFFSIPLLCYWKVLANDDAKFSSLTATEIENCYDKNLCGTANINQIPSQISPEETSPWKVGSSYTMKIFCYNDMPNPVAKSSILDLVVFSIAKEPGVDPADPPSH